MTTTPPAENPETSAPGANALQAPPGDGIHCRACAYDLRGIESSSACPECGTPIARSLAGDQLEVAEPAWLSRIALGLWLDTASTAASCLLLLPAFESLVYGSTDNPDIDVVRSRLAFLTVIGLGLAGTWLMTTREPGVWREPLGPTLRLLLRYGALADALNRVGLSLLFPVRFTDTTSFMSFSQLNLSLVVMVLWWVYVRRIQLRIPSPELAMAAQFTAVGLVICVLVRHWLVWPLLWTDWWELGLRLSFSWPARMGELVLTACAVVVGALTARAVGRIAANHGAGQNHDGGSSSQDTDSPDRG